MTLMAARSNSAAKTTARTPTKDSTISILDFIGPENKTSEPGTREKREVTAEAQRRSSRYLLVSTEILRGLN